MSCKCRSNYLDTDGVPERIIEVPEYYELRNCDGSPKDQIAVDRCIASVVMHLLGNDILTLNSCCGHGKKPPSIIFKDKEGAEDGKCMIASIDDRWFQCMYWEIVEGGVDWTLSEAGKDWPPTPTN